MKNKIIKSEADIEKTIQKYSNTIFKIALSYTKNTQVSEDILQDVLISYMTASPDFHEDQHKKAWIIRVTVNECKKYYRALQYRIKKETLVLPFSASTEKSDIYYAVMDLPQKYRLVIHLYYYEQLSVKEISSILHKKENTVTSLLYRARQKLKDSMEI